MLSMAHHGTAMWQDDGPDDDRDNLRDKRSARNPLVAGTWGLELLDFRSRWAHALPTARRTTTTRQRVL